MSENNKWCCSSTLIEGSVVNISLKPTIALSGVLKQNKIRKRYCKISSGLPHNYAHLVRAYWLTIYLISWDKCKENFVIMDESFSACVRASRSSRCLILCMTPNKQASTDEVSTYAKNPTRDITLFSKVKSPGALVSSNSKRT